MDRNKIMAGTEYEYLDGYWGQKAGLIFDSTLTWQRKEVVSRDAIFHVTDGTVSEIPGGWDHEHCSICWETISQFTEQKTGYVNQKNQWVCTACFESYVKPKCLDFIEIP